MKPKTRTLREMFGDDLDLFRVYCQDGFHIRYGYDTPGDIWAVNPTIELT
jgi:hypothetical protein